MFFYLFLSQNNNLERALEWIFSHPELEEEDGEPALNVMDLENHTNANILAEARSEGPRIKDGPGSKFSFSLEVAIVLLCHAYTIHIALLCLESAYVFWMWSVQFISASGSKSVFGYKFCGHCLLSKLSLDSEQPESKFLVAKSLAWPGLGQARMFRCSKAEHPRDYTAVADLSFCSAV